MAEILPIREIQRRLDSLLEVTNKQDGYTYIAERIHGVTGNSHIRRAQMAGYELVRGDDPENPGERDANGLCIVGDVAIMRIKNERLASIQREMQEIIKAKIGATATDDTSLAKQLSEELSRKLGKPTNVVFNYTDPRELSQRRG